MRLDHQIKSVSAKTTIGARLDDAFSGRFICNLSTIINDCILSIGSTGDKNKLQGTIELLNRIGRMYSHHDPNFIYLINIRKGCTSVLAENGNELIRKLLDILKFSVHSADLMFHSTVVDTIGYFVMRNEKLEPSLSADLIDILGGTLNIITVLNENPKAVIEPKIAYCRRMFQLFTSNIRQTLETYLFINDRHDSVSILRCSILQTLYFVIRFGDSETINSMAEAVINQLKMVILFERASVIMCLQELYVCVFGDRDYYFDIYLQATEVKLSKDYDNLDLSVILELMRGLQIRFTRRSIDRKGLGHAKLNLDVFIHMVEREVRNFPYVHDWKAKVMILFMISKMLGSGIEYSRLDKDGALIRILSKCIENVDRYIASPKYLIRNISHFFAIARNRFKTLPFELTDNVLLKNVEMRSRKTHGRYYIRLHHC